MSIAYVFLFFTAILTFSLQVCSLESNYEKVDLLEDPEFKSFIERFSEHYNSIENLSIEEQRIHDAEFICKLNTYEPVHHIEDIEILGTDGNKIPVRIYYPNRSTTLPMLVYFHGGGWVFGGIEESDAVCRRLANHTGCVVASVGYRLAPEFPFPKPLEDCYAATKWLAINEHRYGNKQNIIVSGESAGGNLAAAVAMMAVDKKEFTIAAQLLIYPVISTTIQDEIYNHCPDQFFLTKDVMHYFWNAYIQSPEDLKHPYASLDYRCELENLPPAIIVSAEYDPLTFDSEKYALTLQNAGVPVIYKMYPKLIHGFLFTSLYNNEHKVKWTKELGEFIHHSIQKS